MFALIGAQWRRFRPLSEQSPFHSCNVRFRSPDDRVVRLNSTCAFDHASRHSTHIHKRCKGISRQCIKLVIDALHLQHTRYWFSREDSLLWSTMQDKCLTFEPTCVKSCGQRWAGLGERMRRAAENDARLTQERRLRNRRHASAERSWASPQQIPHHPQQLEIKLHLDLFNLL